MFQSLRPNSIVYILHKGDTPKLETGYVSNTPVVKPKYAVPHTFGQPQEMVVDISIKINGQIFNYNNIPANLDIADSYSNGESIVISDSKEAMNAEIISLKQKSSDIINSIEFHRNQINKLDEILSILNPEFAEKQAQQEEINNLKTQMSEMSKSMSELMASNRALIEKLQKK